MVQWMLLLDTMPSTLGPFRKDFVRRRTKSLRNGPLIRLTFPWLNKTYPGDSHPRAGIQPYPKLVFTKSAVTLHPICTMFQMGGKVALMSWLSTTVCM